jgi:2-keto-3-deoxy-L-rhamnonate aldolase RhmA
MAATDPVELTNPVLERLRAGEVSLGMIVRLARSGDVVRIAKASGHDFIFIDAQHSLFSLETIGHMAQAALGCGVAVLVRARRYDDPDISLMLDNGVAGIIFPDINNAAEAKRAVEACRFAPLGKRSVAGGYPVFDYRPLPLSRTISALNAATLVVCMIETLEGLENIEAIAAVEGVDVIHVGCNDLLAAMGKPGAFGDPQVVAAVERAIASAARHGKYAGLGGERDLERQLAFIRKGARFVTTQTDIGFLMAEASRRTEQIRKGLS